MIMKKLRSFGLKFQDSKMEEEYTNIKESGVLQDFTVTLEFLFVMNLLLVLPLFIDGDKIDFCIAISTIVCVIILFFLRNKFKQHIHILTLIALFIYNVSRLAHVWTNYPTARPAGLFFQGYTYSAIQGIVLRRIRRIDFRIYAAIVSFGLRFGIMFGAADPDSMDTFIFIRQVFVDAFLIYMFYSSERTERKVFQNFYENRQELKKFKELLDDSLPQSVTILDCETQKPLFSNNAFLNALNHSESGGEHCSGEPTSTHLIHQDKLFPKPQLKSMYVDLSSLREAGLLPTCLSPLLRSDTTMCLTDAIRELIKGKFLSDKAISLTASYKCEKQQRKLFEVILKRVMWDRLDAVAILLNDITNHEKLISLKIANTNKDKIIATVSHELRTPIHGIIGLLETMAKKVSNLELLEDLALCKDNSYLLLNIFNSILDFHQISTGNLRLNPNKVILHKVLRDVTQLFKFQCQEKNILLELKVSKDVPTYIYTDENRLKEILVNLLGNALKFTSRGSIKVEAAEDPENSDFILISVTDTGTGIKEEDKVRLFNLLGQGDKGESVNKNGVGFGLSISNALAAKLCCKDKEIVIQVKGNYGEGSEFSFRILKHLSESRIRSGYAARSETNIEEKDDKEAVYTDYTARQSKQLDKEESNAVNRCNIKEIMERSIESNCYEELEQPLDVSSKMASYMSMNPRSFQDFRYLVKSSKVPFQIGVRAEDIMKQIAPLSEENRLRNTNDTSFLLSPHNKNYILVVDDSPFNLLIARNLIKDLGYFVITAMSGQEAIEITKAIYREGESIKVILMDCQMPVMDGYETTKSLRDMMGKNEIGIVPILAWTANNSEEDIQRCYECGMVGHLTKPTSQEALLEAIAKCGQI